PRPMHGNTLDAASPSVGHHDLGDRRVLVPEVPLRRGRACPSSPDTAGGDDANGELLNSGSGVSGIDEDALVAPDEHAALTGEVELALGQVERRGVRNTVMASCAPNLLERCRCRHELSPLVT